MTTIPTLCAGGCGKTLDAMNESATLEPSAMNDVDPWTGRPLNYCRDCADTPGGSFDDKPIREFVQLDGWADPEHGQCDGIMRCDDDGDICIGSPVREPQRSGTTVRVWVAAGADPADSVRVLRKLLAWAERNDAEVLRPQHWNHDEPPF